MARRNRDTLKDYFKQGHRPTQQAFEDLIDSNLNTLDDGFSSSPQIGIGLAPQTDKGVVISTFLKPGDIHPIWEIAVDPDKKDLIIRRREGDKPPQPAITIKYQESGRSGYHAKDVVVDGFVHSTGRKGNFITGKIPADGKWHDLLDDKQLEDEGCWMFEVVAGCGQRNKGRYALLSALAMHCFGSRRRIRKTRSNFGLFGNRICIRWVKIKGSFSCRLQLKTLFKYDLGVMIDYQIGSLWDNPQMKQPRNFENRRERGNS